MKHRALTFLLLIFLSHFLLDSEGRKFLIVAKSVSDRNFIDFYEGAKDEASRFGDEVELIGGSQAANIRDQDFALWEALDQEVDGIAISVLNDEFLLNSSLKEVERRGIPLIAFDSDFSEENRSHRIAYVGIDNEAYGYAMGQIALECLPEGGTIALIGESPDVSNINARIRGVRRALNNDASTERLNGANGWKENPRTPWYCHDNYDRALNQLFVTLNDFETDIIISCGWWPQMSPRYQSLILPFKEVLQSERKIIICASANETQIEYGREGLSNYNLGIDFYEMGAVTYRRLRDVALGVEIPEYTYLDFITYGWGVPQESMGEGRQANHRE